MVIDEIRYALIVVFSGVLFERWWVELGRTQLKAVVDTETTLQAVGVVIRRRRGCRQCLAPTEEGELPLPRCGALARLTPTTLAHWVVQAFSGPVAYKSIMVQGMEMSNSVELVAGRIHDTHQPWVSRGQLTNGPAPSTPFIVGVEQLKEPPTKLKMHIANPTATFFEIESSEMQHAFQRDNSKLGHAGTPDFIMPPQMHPRSKRKDPNGVAEEGHT
ncbi:hypothetical protein QC763_0026010 [Podospora pseudopauciseta]|uniref:Uncharacterized protein n=1 Tax=Podospora pseudopauciseta TaxID=2093780 RepID=A0ABR0I3B0_9PEZI|nr:hypothetical protein QC763_0026010 [Podospora pseudopauciseta]